MKKASDIILNNPRAIEHCKRLGGQNWMELYNESWLSMREAELKGAKIDEPIKYFYSVVWSKSRFRKTRIKKRIEIVLSDELVNSYDYATEETQDRVEIIEGIIYKYLDKEPENMIDKFYQDFCRAILGFKSIKEAQEGMQICRTTFWVLLNQLQEDLRNE